ncbi:MAG: putative selenate ABC transporter substrate-binding protein [Actinomycetota bacterium]
MTTGSSARLTLTAAVTAFTVIVAACGSDTSSDESSDTEVVLRIGAIPDQEPERLQRTYDLLSEYLEAELDGVDVEYVPVTEYSAAVTGFAVGDFDLAWFGALTGVQARNEVDGAAALAQRDIDETFTSVYIARADSGIEPVDSVDGLAQLEGRSFTFGSESSTSGRLMPQSFLTEAGIDVNEDFAGEPGFSGSHDATIELVNAGTFEAGAVSSEVWDSRVAEGAVDTDEIIEVFRTPPYYNYHWVGQPDLDTRFGEGFTTRVLDALMGLDPNDSGDAAILELFSAEGFILTEDANYDAIEAVARDVGLVRE